MIPNHKEYIEAIKEKKKLALRFYSRADSQVIDLGESVFPVGLHEQQWISYPQPPSGAGFGHTDSGGVI